MLKKSDYLKQESIEKLWSHEKTTFRFWVWSYFAFLLSLVIISLINVVLYYFADFSSINPALIVGTTKPLDHDAINAISQKFMQGVIVQIIYNVALLTFFVFGIQKSYENRNFKYLNLFVISLVYLTVFINIISFITLINDFSVFYKNVSVMGKFPIAILGLNIFQSIITIIFGILLGREITAIKRAFVRLEILKEQENLMRMMKNMGVNASNPYGMYNPFMGGFAPNANQYNQAREENIKEVDETEEVEISKEKPLDEKVKTKDDLIREEEIKKLLDLPNQKLFKIAEKLNIFGYEDLTKEELAEKIYIYTKNQK
ncbi:hypothetical protein DP067_03000 [Mycoplasmopsis anatis]|uniref:Rho termination factor N-terminal domain-containing protein n=1 Tax=Mycoplasmopsis anatis 1340 TaxID=1034808 RepID=F9QEE5_9BACT|nr:hypothetical protein [Mycoplasmopsis anatis]AWX70307.1 hypothetical protein DP067_03000 [Mycoplasmopsis anatis]EGS28872.1 hypothetical protein GIG_03804 [Mycoplasmopsis anatis 1340]VEU74049.1 Uncharacterised protein [Mycoplasmopsis anatis]